MRGPGALHIVYLEGPRRLRVTDPAALPRFYQMIDPRDGTVLSQGKWESPGDPRRNTIETPDQPCVIVFTNEPAAGQEQG